MNEATADPKENEEVKDPVDDPKEEVENKEDQPKEEVAEGEEPKPEEQEEDEIVLVREGSRPKLKKQTRRMSERINQLNAGKKEQKDRADGLETEVAALREKNSVMELALEQSRNKVVAPVRPNVDDFEEGVKDPKYVEAFNKYDTHRIKKAVNDELNQVAQTSTQQAKVDTEALNLLKKQEAHFARADEFKAKNFDEVQGVAIEHLGKDVVNDIIREYPDSELIIYWYGTNPGEADALMKIMEQSTVLGVSEIGVLRKELKKMPKSKIIPDPDEELEGATTSNSAIGKSFERKLEKLRANLDNKELGGIRAIIKLKKEAKEKGVILE